MNVMRLGGRVTGHALSWDLVQTFLSALGTLRWSLKKR